MFFVGSKNIADDIAVLFGSLSTLFLIPYLIAYLISKFSKTKDKKLILWKVFIKIYPIILILTVIGSLTK
jgi:Cu/Ag efflux pump CusA